MIPKSVIVICILSVFYSKVWSTNAENVLLSTESSNGEHCSSDSCDTSATFDCDALIASKSERLVELDNAMLEDESKWKNLESKKMFYVESSGSNHLSTRQVSDS
jgi:hypothetical protein